MNDGKIALLKDWFVTDETSHFIVYSNNAVLKTIQKPASSLN